MTTAPERPAAKPSTIPALDSVRFIGVLAVLLTHTAFQAGIYTSTGWFGHVMSRLAVGVAVFFVLSGFLLSREWLVRAVARQPAPSARRYYWKRLWRIYPAYLVVGIVVLVGFGANHDRGPSGWLRSLLMLDPYTPHALPDAFTQTWSLTTEVAFYVALPPLMWALLGRRLHAGRIGAGLALLGAVSIAWLLGPAQGGALSGLPSPEWLPAYLSWFAAGMWLAVLHTSPSTFPRAARAARRLAAVPGVCWTIALALLLVASTPLAGPWLVEPLTASQEVVRHALYLGVGVLVIVPPAFGPPTSSWVQLLSHRGARHLGHISYSLFLTHLAVIQFVLWAFGFPLFGGHFAEIVVLSLALSLLASELLYRFVERPLTRFGRRFAREPATTPTAPSAR